MQCIICLQYLSRCSQPGLSISLSVRAARLLRLTARPGIHGSANVMELPSPCAFSFAIPCQLSCAHALACLFVFLQEKDKLVQLYGLGQGLLTSICKTVARVLPLLLPLELGWGSGDTSEGCGRSPVHECWTEESCGQQGHPLICKLERQIIPL